jgi:uncharacterized FAD-dependent dehydrogenase
VVGSNLANIYHTIIIGAGPAGLATASSLQQQGLQNFLLLEQGAALDDRQRGKDIAAGIGGAGLFSDGKFSFYPSATWLWKNLDPAYLESSYAWLHNILLQFNQDVPGFAHRTLAANSFDANFKEYPSFYIDYANRHAIIAELIKPFAANIITNSAVTNISQLGGMYCIETQHDKFLTKNIVIATGRMGPLQLQNFDLTLQQEFQRIEVGVRLEGPYTHPFFKELQKHSKYPDPKFIFTDDQHQHVSWRTFCFCQRGEIVSSNYDGYLALSGRADCAPTCSSNIGFNTRIKIPSFNNMLPRLETQFRLPIAEVFANSGLLAKYFDPLIANYVTLGLCKLKNHFTSLADYSSIDIVGPTIEGIGYFPTVNQNLQSGASGIYITGDAVGVFRGLTAAILSGHYVGQQIMKQSIAPKGMLKYANSNCHWQQI